ncbi:TetR/AcrR family transcriptional regulator [Leptospira kobayashii]|nr:TetR/AcrR family transcriptional regulator [Leptospira kobayashii]
MTKVDNKKQIAREKSIERIRNSAIHLFSKNGFSATTMEMIAKHAKVSKGLAYNYFKSKNQIFESILNDYLSKQEALNAGISTNQAAVDYLRELFQKTLEFLVQERKTLILLTICKFQPNSLILSKKMTENIEKRFAPYHEAMKDRFKKLGIADPELELLYVKTFFHGLIMSQCTDSDIYPKHQIVEIFLSRYTGK